MSVARGPRRVVVTGLGVVSVLGCDVSTFWTRLLRGDSGVAAIDDDSLADCPTQVFAAVQGFDPEAYTTARERQRLSRTSQFAIVAAQQALEQAGLDVEACRDRHVGTFIGVSSGGFVAVEPMMREFFKTGVVGNALCIPTVMNSAPASNLSLRFGLTGPSMTFDAACSSSTHAIGQALNQIRYGGVDAAVVGGADTPFATGMVSAWAALRVLSVLNDPPEQACRPFSLDRGGMVLGEGAAMMILEAESSAVERGATILGELSGYGASSDSHHITKPSTVGIGRAVRAALDDAGIHPTEVQHVNAHATGTRFNDAIETAVIRDVFGTHADHLAVVGTKPAHGHTLAATGAHEFLASVLAVMHQQVPPTLNVLVPDPECDLDYIVDGPRHLDISNVVSNSFAFGGNNAVAVLSRYSAAAPDART